MHIIKGIGEKARQPAKRRGLIFAALAVVVVGGGAMLAMKPKAPAEGAEENTASIQLVTAVAVAPYEFSRIAPVSGEVRPVHDIRVFAPAPNVRVAAVMAEIGDIVEAGQPLARLDMNVVDAQINEAEALLRQAQVEQKRAADEYARIAPIAETGALSSEEVANRKAAMDSATAKLTAQKAAYAQVTARVQGGFVRAPEAGLVIERNARVGEYADQKSLFRIVGDNRLEVAAAVSESDILALKAGQTAIFTASDGATVEASLRVGPVAVDSTTRTGEALFDLPADAPVRAGMYLRGEVVTEKISALAVPQAAISYASGEPCVFVITDGVAHLTPVTLGVRADGRVAVMSGIKQGDVVASGGGAFLLDGDAVRVADTVAAR